LIIDKAKIKSRAAGLDLFRVVAVLMVLLFHGHIHHGCSYGPMAGFVSMGAIFMTAFFMLSGFVLYMTYREQPLIEIQSLKKFYLKRIIGIIPLYYIVAILYVIFLGKETAFQNIVLFPIEALALQCSFSSLFAVSHNDGTWFISCLMFAYLLFPLMQEVAKQLSTKAKVLAIALSIVVLLWSPVVVHYFSTDSIYSNPFFRGLEFFIGVLLCSLPVKWKSLFTWKAAVVEAASLVALVSVAVKMNLFVGNYMLYNIIALPLFACMLLTLSGLKSPVLQNSRMLRYASAVSYAFFLAQTFNTQIEKVLFANLDIQDNALKIVVSVVVCSFVAVLLHELAEKPCTSFFKKRWL